MTDIRLEVQDRRALERARAFVRRWCEDHALEVGVAEMVLGASAIALGIQSGAIEMGRDLVASAMSGFNLGSGIGAAIGGSAGATAGALLGSIGVATGGTAIALPASLLVGGGALLLGALGYTAGDVIHNYLRSAMDIGQLLKGASLLVVGTVLIVDGARRIMKDERVQAATARVCDYVIHLPVVDVVARNAEQLKAWAGEHPELAAQAVRAAGLGTVVAAGAGGAAAGSALAAGSVTVLGSHALGGAALSLGLISAPVWPVALGGILAAGLGYVAWSGGRRFVHIRWASP